MNTPSTTLYHVHDPMCSWCWGYRPTWERLKAALPGTIKVTNVLGGLAPDSDQPMPPDLREAIQGHWVRIQTLLGTEFNFDFWTRCEPRRSTYPACRAVLAAKDQDSEEAMIRAIQHAYYRKAMNPSDDDVLVRLATGMGMDSERFENYLNSQDAQQELTQQVELARSWGVPGFPSLVLQADGVVHGVPVDYQREQTTLGLIANLLAGKT